jgi:transposase
MQPLGDALGTYVLGAEKLHADDTPVPVLAPGTGKTKQGRLWVYVRDDRRAGSTDALAVWLRYSPDRKGKHPCEHLHSFGGILQADGYAGFNGLYDRPKHPPTEAACWAHCPESRFIRSAWPVMPRNPEWQESKTPDNNRAPVRRK